MAGYDPATIEPKWQKFWVENKTFKVEMDPDKPKYYILDMFPYPSGSGLHVGHPEGYTATDIIARYKRMQGFNVLHPMGWDAFGLPAEQHALKHGTHPRDTTSENIANFKRQIRALGFSYDWDREVDTTDPDYYQWTQWIFLQLYHKGLAYLDEVAVNWCPALGTVLANEEVVGGVSERGGHPVVRKRMKQWMLKITDYAERLLTDLEELDWPEKIKAMQRNWIGKSTGAEVDFAIDGHDDVIRVFTTRPDTLFGATFMVLAPEHPFVDAITTPEQRDAVADYRGVAARKSDLERTELSKDKTGVFTGAYAINPVNDERIPIWIADYVLISYGTGAIMSVPGHDERDWEFARTFGLQIREVISGGNVEEAAHTGDGTLVNSGLINGLNVTDAKAKITAWLEEKGLGQGAVNYKLRDWLFCRQRYWGEPFPVIYLEDGSHKALPDSELPLRLPDVESYAPTGTPESPLAGITEWVQTTDPETGAPATRETNTMPQWAGSCWYYLRFLDPKNPDAGWSQEKENYWMPVDLYVGGAEHAVLHLLYARFWHKVLFDLGYVHTQEPFAKLFNQGMILGFSYTDPSQDPEDPAYYVPYEQVERRDGKAFHKETGAELTVDVEKMSKSRGNVVNPDDVVNEYGADALRLYEMFLGPLEQTKPWDPDGVTGVHRFLARAWRFVTDMQDTGVNAAITDAAKLSEDTERLLHQTIKKVGEDIEGMRFNTAIAQLMVLLNAFYKLKKVPRSTANTFVLLIAPFAPHLAEELWSRLGHTETLAYEPWPEYVEEKTKEKSITMAVQVMGKTRATIEVAADAGKDTVLEAARNEPNVARYLEGKTIRKEIFVPGRIVNFVAT